MKQKTIRREISSSGIGLHSGKPVEIALSPARENTGIIFRIHTQDGIYHISPSPESVVATGLATTLGVSSATVSTVEHILASLLGSEIDNIFIDVKGGEIPIMDGSAAPFLLLLKGAGIRKQNAQRAVYSLKKELLFQQDNKYIKAKPHNGFFIEYTIDFAHPLVGIQNFSMEVTPESFATIAKARTFGFLKEIEYLHSNNLALGGSLENAIVLSEQEIINEEGLRYADEFVRHKILDFIGDMAMYGKPILGHFEVYCSGHALNNQFLRYISSHSAEYLLSGTVDEKEEVRKNEKHSKGAMLVPKHL
ncbi:MAG: UDP-3-O-acyl-N-acetylglucosamine deacetylase [Desulfovibrionaceae bacterium]